jgi:ABC-three component (ABC-3C) system Middle Component 2
MEEEVTEDETPQVALFNGSLETGVRAVVVLDAAYPRSLDLARLTWFDHLVVHTADIGGPPSLHPDIPQRTGELLVRRRLVEEGVNLMRRLHMIDANVCPHGIVFEAGEEASAFVDSLRSGYARELKLRAAWLVNYLAEMSDDTMAALIDDRIGRWAVEFQGEVGPAGSSP